MPVREPTTERGRATRARIVQATAELVAEEGAAATSLDAVGARAPASRSQLYHYFEDRDDLIRAAVGATTEAVLVGQDALFAELGSWDGIARWFDAMVAVQVDRQARGGCPLGSLVGQLAERDEQARDALAAAFDRWEEHLRTGLARLQSAGGLGAGADPAWLAAATMASLQGGLLLTQVRRDPTQLRIALDAAWTVLRATA